MTQKGRRINILRKKIKCLISLLMITVVLALFFLMIPQTAYAYLDLQTGSYLIQLIIAALLGVSFGIKVYWRKIKTIFAKHFSKRLRDGKDDD